MPVLATLTFRKRLLPHRPSSDTCALPFSLLDFPFFKPQGGLHSAEFLLLLPASDCLLPAAKVISSVIQLKLLYFLIAEFLLSVVPPRSFVVYPFAHRSPFSQMQLLTMALGKTESEGLWGSSVLKAERRALTA